MALEFLRVIDRPLMRYLDTTGDGTGEKGATGDYSTIETAFKILPKPGVQYRISTLVVFICDAPNPKLSNYGSMDALTNGILIYHRTSRQILTDFTDGIPIKSNLDWNRQCLATAFSAFQISDDAVIGRWSMFNTNAPILIDGSSDEWFEILLRDDFTALSRHLFRVQGSIQ